MWLKVDPRLSAPMYQQIIDGIREQIAREILRPGERLPPVRELAADISVNYNTVAKAYQELERENVIELVQGRGTFVATPTEPPDISIRKRALREAMQRWMVDAHYANMSSEELRQMFDEVLAEWNRNKGGTTA
jgi:GntR family transcriptional regulator